MKYRACSQSLQYLVVANTLCLGPPKGLELVEDLGNLRLQGRMNPVVVYNLADLDEGEGFVLQARFPLQERTLLQPALLEQD